MATITKEYSDRYGSPYTLSLDTVSSVLTISKPSSRMLRTVGGTKPKEMLGVDLDGGPMFNVGGIISINNYQMTILEILTTSSVLCTLKVRYESKK